MALPWSLESGRPAADCGPAFRRSGGWPMLDRDPGEGCRKPSERPGGAHVYEMYLK